MVVEKILIVYNDVNIIKHYLSDFIVKNYNLEVQWLELTGHQPILTDSQYQSYVLNQLQQIVIDEQIHYLICLFEETFFISKIRRFLENHCSVLISDTELYYQLHDKRAGCLFSQQHNIKTIPTMLLTNTTSKHSIEKFINNQYPIYAKHYDSRGGWGTEIYYSVDALLSSKPICDNRDEYIIQPCVKGDIYVINVLYHQGKLIDRHIIKKLSLWDDQSTVRCIPFNLSQNIDRFDDTLINIGVASNFSGVVDIEFIVNEELYLMEYNPRFGGDFASIIINDASIVYNYMNLLLGKPIIKPYSYDEMITSLPPLLVTRYLKKQFSQNKLEFFKFKNILSYYKMKKNSRTKVVDFKPIQRHIISEQWRVTETDS